MNGIPHLLYMEEKRVSLSTSPTYEFFLYNLDTLTAMPAVQWLSGRNDVDWLTAHLFYLSKGYFNLLVTRFYGLDIGIDLDLETVLAPKVYDDVMQVIYLPEGEYSVNTFSLQFLDSQPKIVLLPRQMRETHIPLYLLDYQEMVLTDYCYSVQEDLFKSFAVSASEKFISFTKSQLGSNDYPGGEWIQAVEIVDLDTGHSAIVPDANFGVIGWIKP
jgi:hypothetical protein